MKEESSTGRLATPAKKIPPRLVHGIWGDPAKHTILHHNGDMNSEATLLRIDPSGIQSVPNPKTTTGFFLSNPLDVFDFQLLPLTATELSDGVRALDIEGFFFSTGRAEQLLAYCWTVLYPFVHFVNQYPHLRLENDKIINATPELDIIHAVVQGPSFCDGPVLPTRVTGVQLVDKTAVLVRGCQSDHIRKWTCGMPFGELVQVITHKLPLDIFYSPKVRYSQMPISNIIATGGLPSAFDLSVRVDSLWLEVANTQAHSDLIYGEALPKLWDSRDLIVSTILHLASNILARISTGGATAWETWIAQNHPSHAKCHLNEFLALAGLCLDEILPILDPSTTPQDVMMVWIQNQDLLDREILQRPTP